MKGFIKKKRGFTLVELVVVVAVLGVLTGVVLPNVVGMMGRGSAQTYDTDQETIQLATSTFYSDTHACWDSDAVGGPLWGCNDTNAANAAGHYYPTELAYIGDHTLTPSTTESDIAGGFPDNPRLIGGSGSGGVATDTDIEEHAIWMGLLVNAPGVYDSPAGTSDRHNVSVLENETGLYLQEIPESAMEGNTRNGAPAGRGGIYCWIVGENGNVYGSYRTAADTWYAGFGGGYP